MSPMSPSYLAVLVAGVVFAAFAAASLTVLRAPYGRFGADGFGPTLPTRLGWLVMEAPALIAFVATARGSHDPGARLFIALWLIHYAHRAIIYPTRMRVRPGARMSVSVVALGAAVTATHGALFGTWIGAQTYGPSWVTDPRFIAGIALYVTGFALNVLSDATLRALRDGPTDPDGYAIPHGGGFRWVSCPNYAGEILGWIGLSIAAACPGGWFIVAISLANLVPRAVATHRWYRARFADYPTERCAIVPWLL